jgi:hypothetical protein
VPRRPGDDRYKMNNNAKEMISYLDKTIKNKPRKMLLQQVEDAAFMGADVYEYTQEAQKFIQNRLKK